MMSSTRRQSIRAWQAEVYKVSADHGFHDEEIKNGVDVPAKLCLIHSEISEALEENRDPVAREKGHYYVSPTGKPEGFGIELADAAIRIMDLAESMGIDLENMIEIKSGYNRTRPYKHGKVYG